MLLSVKLWMLKLRKRPADLALICNLVVSTTTSNQEGSGFKIIVHVSFLLVLYFPPIHLNTFVHICISPAKTLTT